MIVFLVAVVIVLANKLTAFLTVVSFIANNLTDFLIVEIFIDVVCLNILIRFGMSFTLIYFDGEYYEYHGG